MFKFLVTVVTSKGLQDEVMTAPTWASLKTTLSEQKIIWTQAYKLNQVK